MDVLPTDKVLHFSFADEAYERADVFCGKFTKRQIANKEYKELDVECTRLPFKDKEFDFAMCANVLGYVSSPIKIVEEIKRICKRANFREHSEFAEMVFGWNETKWIVAVENNELVIKSKNWNRHGRFESLFHHLYNNDPIFFEQCNKNPGILNVSVDWYEEDDIITEQEVEVEEDVLIEDDTTTESLFEDVEKPEPKYEKKLVKKIIKNAKTVFRPNQLEYFDNNRFFVGTIADQIDVRKLKNKNLA